MGAYVSNGGYIALHKKIEKEDAPKIKKFFVKNGYGDKNVYQLDNVPNELGFECDGHLEQVFLDKLKVFIESLGYDILPETYIRQYGDEDGGWFYEGDKFVFLSDTEQNIHFAKDEYLIAELKRRGYEIRRCDI